MGTAKSKQEARVRPNSDFLIVNPPTWKNDRKF
jgi:hypothetical protein